MAKKKMTKKEFKKGIKMSLEEFKKGKNTTKTALAFSVDDEIAETFVAYCERNKLNRSKLVTTLLRIFLIDNKVMGRKNNG